MGVAPAGVAAAADPTDRRRTPAGPLPVWVRLGLAVVIAIGVALRIIAPGTTVFCNDQARACALAQDIAEGRWESGGLVNSGGFRNAPGYVYLLAAVWRLWPSPEALQFHTVLVNLAALVASAYLLYRWIGGTAAWWATAFLAAAPWAIQYCRWIWAQDLLFPAALLVYAALWRWLCQGHRWAACAMVLALGLITQIHLAGGVLALAVVLLLLYWRVRPPLIPVAVGLIVVLASFVPYVAACHPRMPPENRVAYRHVWRTIPAAAMSVSGLNWSLEFRGGYPHFAEHLAWRRWPFEIVMVAPVLLLLGGLALAGRELRRGKPPASMAVDASASISSTLRRPTPLGLITGLTLLVPAAFVFLAVRTSPTYMPLWYPLPFAIIGLASARLLRWQPGAAWRSACCGFLFLILFAELGFFVTQLQYVASHGGVPASPLSRSLAGLDADRRNLACNVMTSEIWVQFDGVSAIMDEATAYQFRRATWAGATPGRSLIHYIPPWEGTSWSTGSLTAPPASEHAYQVHPWQGRQQRDGRVLRVPEPESASR